jgi:nucleoside-diphosphate-sugar epimerase
VASSLFITGASGFIGHHLLARINPEQFNPVYCLARNEATARKLAGQKHFHWLIGSIFDSDVYGSRLDSSDMVIHLAATTGKARPDEYFRVNATGTRYLVEQCKQRGVKNFLYVSTIAVKYRNKSNYPYAQSKQEAEEAVKQSGLNYAIVRPTIVLGKESSGWNALSKLARLPLIVVFGDGSTRTQPIEVDDLVDAMIAVVKEEDFHNESFDLGGPDTITIEEFLKKVRRLYRGNTRKVLHLPYEPLKRIVAYADSYLPSVLPLNAGQLSVFVQDGTVTSNRVYEKQRPYMKDLDTVLRLLVQ